MKDAKKEKPIQERRCGSFAPPLTEETIKDYARLADKARPEVLDAMQTLLRLVAKWWGLPISKAQAVDHNSGVGKAIPLTSDLQEELFEDIPWMHELDGMGVLFEKIPTNGVNKEIRNAAFHLLWHAKELCLDREPICTAVVDNKRHYGDTDTLLSLMGK